MQEGKARPCTLRTQGSHPPARPPTHLLRRLGQPRPQLGRQQRRRGHERSGRPRPALLGLRRRGRSCLRGRRRCSSSSSGGGAALGVLLAARGAILLLCRALPPALLLLHTTARWGWRDWAPVSAPTAPRPSLPGPAAAKAPQRCAALHGRQAPQSIPRPGNGDRPSMRGGPGGAPAPPRYQQIPTERYLSKKGIFVFPRTFPTLCCRSGLGTSVTARSTSASRASSTPTHSSRLRLESRPACGGRECWRGARWL